MKRKDALQYLKYAGYHNDSKEFIRLYVENRVSISVAREWFAKGQQAKAGGVKCNCYQCKQPD